MAMVKFWFISLADAYCAILVSGKSVHVFKLRWFSIFHIFSIFGMLNNQYRHFGRRLLYSCEIRDNKYRSEKHINIVVN